MIRIGNPPTAADHVVPTGPPAAPPPRPENPLWGVLDRVTTGLMLSAAMILMIGIPRLQLLGLELRELLP